MAWKLLAIIVLRANVHPYFKLSEYHYPWCLVLNVKLCSKLIVSLIF
ncbi:Hypothetical protein I595_3497 [Croceitalea dokdonensis DOKDO 023]|uniref:Uncharacterized protein n=1 Tax=Croceitalea dokdonensis DOKDO 023 TaxID=1300341 RepID=A0A0N8H3G1_9FLAO|nr:Hypothetical protein I595_3497 [Croceitalea dokdonensis DOKDO 023]